MPELNPIMISRLCRFRGWAMQGDALEIICVVLASDLAVDKPFQEGHLLSAAKDWGKSCIRRLSASTILHSWTITERALRISRLLSFGICMRSQDARIPFLLRIARLFKQIFNIPFHGPSPELEVLDFSKNARWCEYPTSCRRVCLWVIQALDVWPFFFWLGVR